MNSTWTHYVGRAFYSDPQVFQSEAEKYGVTRRVALNALKRMAWNDRILLLQGDMVSRNRKTELKGSILIGEFQLETLTGLSAAAIRALQEAFTLEQIDEGGVFVKRACGHYQTGPSYGITASLFDIVEELMDISRQGTDVGKLMIGGSFIPWDPYTLPEVTFHWGFRGFDWEHFTRALSTLNGNPLVVSGEFKIPMMNSDESEEMSGRVQEIRNYCTAELYHPLVSENVMEVVSSGGSK